MTAKQATFKTQSGFTLIELMIVVVILGIIAAVALPSYRESVVATRRSDGMILMNQILQAQERYFVNNMTYSADLTDLGYTTAGNIESEKGFYRVSAAACGGGITECVNITAVPQDGQAVDGNLTINSQGLKTGNWDLK